MTDKIKTYCNHCGEEGIYLIVDDNDDSITVKLKSTNKKYYYYEFRHRDGNGDIQKFSLNRETVQGMINSLIEVLDITKDDTKEWCS